jgi:hypothetical protein
MIFIFVPYGLLLGLVRPILQWIDWFESQLLVPRSCWGHARRKINEEKTALIPLIQIKEWNELINRLNTINTEI